MTSTIFRNIMFWYFLLANGKKDNTGNWKPTMVIFARKSKFLPHLAPGHRPFRPCSPGTIGNLLQMWFKAHFHQDLSCSQCQYVCLVRRQDKIFAEAKATFKNVLRYENWKVEADYANKVTTRWEGPQSLSHHKHWPPPNLGPLCATPL